MKVNVVVPLKGAKGIDLDVVVASILRATKDENPTVALKNISPHVNTCSLLKFYHLIVNQSAAGPLWKERRILWAHQVWSSALSPKAS